MNIDLQCWRADSVERRPGGIEGLGLFATKPIRKNDLLAVKAGKIVDEATVIEYAEVIQGSHLQIEKDLFLAGLSEEEVDRTLIGYNHSCTPNAYVSGQIEIRAMRDIGAGEEITVDYATAFMSDTQSFTCLCGSPECRKLIKPSVDYKNSDLRKKYEGYFADYIQREIDQQQS